MEEAVSTFHSVVGAEHQNGGPQVKQPLAETEIPPAGQTKNSGWIKPSRDGKELKATP